MRDKKLRWTKTLPAVLSAVMMLQNCVVVSAEGAELQAEVQALKSLTAAELETGEQSAASARLKIGDWLDYGDYGIEREDVPGTTYFFYITTKDEAENLINDRQLAYCIQSYFLTPLPGDHTEDMTDNVLSICGQKNVNKALYYGYGGVGYDAEAFDSFLKNADPQYYENVYTYLSDSEKEELAYILTHGAASYAYFTDGTDLEEYYKLQFKIKYGEDGERQYGYFKKQELKKAGLETEDMNLLGATYGMNPTGIALAKAWYDVLAAKTDPALSMLETDGVYTFTGNEQNEALSIRFAVPEDWTGLVVQADGTEEMLEAGAQVELVPTETIQFTYTGEAFSAEENGLPDEPVIVDGILTGAEHEVWSLVLLETNKGNENSVSKRQQDIAAISWIDAGRTELDFELKAEKGSIFLENLDDAGHPVPGAAFNIYYDEACSDPVQINGEDVLLTTDEQGSAYLEFLINEKLAAQDNKLYVKAVGLPEGYAENDMITWVKANGSLSVISPCVEMMKGTLVWNVPEGAELPESVEVVLMRNGEEFDSMTVTAADGWSYEWSNLNANGTDADGNTAAIEYTVEVRPVDGFAMEMVNGELVCRITGNTDVTGEVVWYDGGDTDALRPETVTVKLYRDEEEIGSAEASEADGWTYSFGELPKYNEDGSREYTYRAEIETPEGYTAEEKDGQIVFVHPASAAAVVEGSVDLSGRELKPGDFSFSLVQVTDASAAEEVEGGYAGTAQNDAEGRFAFEDLTFTEEGTFYYKLTSDDGQTYVVKADVTAGGEHGDQLEVTLTYLDQDGNELSAEEAQSAMSFAKEYHAAGEWQMSDISITVEGEELEAGQFQIQMKDADGNVLQTKENDADGRVVFDPIPYTEADIDQEYVYTFVQIPNEENPDSSDATEYTATVKVEDSEAGDGTLKITVEVPTITFVNKAPETEAVTEAVTEKPTEEAPETEAVTEAVTEKPTEEAAETETETQIPAEAENKTTTWSLWSIIILILMIILYIIRRRKNK